MPRYLSKGFPIVNDIHKRVVAKIAYKQVMAVIDQWENQSYLFPINFH